MRRDICHSKVFWQHLFLLACETSTRAGRTVRIATVEISTMTASWPTRPNRAAASEPGALRPRDAARFLSISERHLWALTKRGEVPSLKLGRVTLYARETLVELLRKRSAAAEGGAQ